jgi:hypothetical protein
VPDGRLRLQLVSAPDAGLLAWLNVRYLLMDRLRDRWTDGVYYDLGVSQPLAPDASLRLAVQPAFPSSAIGVALAAPGGTWPTGRLDVQGGPVATTVRIDGAPRGGQTFATDVDPGTVWLTRAPLVNPAVDGLTVTWRGSGPVTLRAISLIDERSGASQAVVVDPRYRLAFLGDMKIYEDLAVLPRAFLANGLAVVYDPREVVDRLRDPTWRPQDEAVAAAPEVSHELAFRASGDPGTARIVADDPERVVVATQSTDRRVLVLTDTVYPGWQATLDGAPAPILPVDTQFRGVLLPPGSHQVVFAYRPSTWALGLVASGAGLLCLALGLWLSRRGRAGVDTDL